jgi:hypothetical protein
MCPRCGLDLVVPAYLSGKVPPELDTTVLQPMAAARKAESKLPATLVLCAVAVLAAGMVLAGGGRSGSTAQATSGSATPNVTLAPQASTPTRAAKSFSSPASPTRTSPHAPALLPTLTAAPPPPTATRTRTPADTPVPPSPTPTPPPPESQPAGPAKLLPGVGSYASDFNGWTVKLDGTGSRPVLWSSGPTTRHDAQGTFRLAYLVYSNDGSAPRSLATTLDFVMKGSDGHLYPEYTGRGRDLQRGKIAAVLHANPPDFTVAPGQRTATVLVFDLPSGVEPEQLVGRVLEGDAISPDGQVAWDLTSAR